MIAFDIHDAVRGWLAAVAGAQEIVISERYLRDENRAALFFTRGSSAASIGMWENGRADFDMLPRGETEPVARYYQFQTEEQPKEILGECVKLFTEAAY